MLPQSILYEVAQMANVTLDQVISVVLGHDDVESEIRTRVLTVMKLRESFQSNSNAAKAARKIAAVVSGQVMDDYVGSVIRGAAAVAKQHGCELVIHVQKHNRRDNLSLLLSDAGVDGVIAVVPLDFEGMVELYHMHERPYVFVDYRGALPSEAALVIEARNMEGMAAITRHLVSLGHRRIGFIAGPLTYASAHQRLQGYQTVLREAGVPDDPALVLEGNWQHSAGYVLTKKLLRLADPPTAVAASNDLMAFGAIQAVQEAGLTIGEDISITGFDDIDMAAVVSPPLTTVRQPTQLMGGLAMELLIKRINGEQVSAPHVYVDTELMIRQSTGPVRASP
jgi:LacI family transcriptional regulator